MTRDGRVQYRCAPNFMMIDPTDDELMARVGAGNRLAFEQIHDRYGPRVYAFLWRLIGDEAIAADLRQDVFFRLWQARGNWKRGGSVPGYRSALREIWLSMPAAGSGFTIAGVKQRNTSHRRARRRRMSCWRRRTLRCGCTRLSMHCLPGRARFSFSSGTRACRTRRLPYLSGSLQRPWRCTWAARSGFSGRLSPTCASRPIRDSRAPD